MTDETNTIVDDRRASEPVGGAAKDRPKGRSLKPLAMLWPYVKRHPITVTTALVFLLLGTAVTLSIPLLLGDAVDVGLGGDLASEELIAKIDGNFFLVFLAVVALGVIGAVRFTLFRALANGWRLICAMTFMLTCSASVRAFTPICARAKRCRG